MDQNTSKARTSLSLLTNAWQTNSGVEIVGDKDPIGASNDVWVEVSESMAGHDLELIEASLKKANVDA